MVQNRTIVLKGAEGFSKGVLENAGVDNSCVAIDRVAGRYMQYGAYTTREFSFAEFSEVVVSWNIETVPNTLAEVRCRILSNDEWSEWFSFGKWSTDYKRENAAKPLQTGQAIYSDCDTIRMKDGVSATGVQVKVSLFTNDEKVSPAMRLLCISVKSKNWEKQNGNPINYSVYTPAYVLNDHADDRGINMELPLVLMCLINRRGADVLPWEIAFGMLDYARNDCDNGAYAVAMAGACGYGCYRSFMDIKDLRMEIREDHAVAVQLIKNENQENEQKQWFVLSGFEREEESGVDFAILGDVRAETYEGFLQKMPLDIFEKRFTNRAIALHKHDQGVPKCRPVRYLCKVEKGGDINEFFLSLRGARVEFERNFAGWAACVAPDGVVYATTADKTFNKLAISENGSIIFPQELLVANVRYTIFVVNEIGCTYTGSITMPASLPVKTEEGKEKKGELK